MKKSILILITVLVTSCAQAPKKSTENPQFFGEFLYLADAAVLNTGTEIYGVIITRKCKSCTSCARPLSETNTT